MITAILFTQEELLKIMPRAAPRLDKFYEPLLAAMNEFHIDTQLRTCAFLAQIAHESLEMLYVRELASGVDYEGRTDLGNTQPGDGRKFRGRGLIQITGRANYKDCSMALFGDHRLLTNPEILEQPEEACRSACWFWATRGLNELADAEQFERITRRINGGLNGQDKRLAYYAKAKEVLIK